MKNLFRCKKMTVLDLINRIAKDKKLPKRIKYNYADFELFDGDMQYVYTIKHKNGNEEYKNLEEYADYRTAKSEIIYVINW